jgi:hypothetical protein
MLVQTDDGARRAYPTLAAACLGGCAGLWCMPAHAFFIRLSPGVAFLVWLYLVLPYVLPVLLVTLALLWRRRQRQRPVFFAVLGLALAGAAVFASFLVPQWVDDARGRAERKYWDGLDTAAAAGNLEEAVRMIKGRGDAGMQEYVARSVDSPDAKPNEVLLRTAFKNCADLLSGGLLGTDLLEKAIANGQAGIIQAWLGTAQCQSAIGGSREERLAEFVYHLLPPDLGQDEAVKRQSRVRQAEALGVLAKRYPALLDVDISAFGCRRNPAASSRCTVVSELLENWHDAGLATLLPLDARAEQHLPAVAWHLLHGEVDLAIAAARADPELFYRLLPSLMATMPADGVHAALKAVPPSEEVLLSPKKGDSIYQHLSGLFDAARRRDEGRAEWTFLWRLFDLFPTRLAEVDPGLFDAVLIGAKPQDAQVVKMFAILRGARTPCKALLQLLPYMDSSLETGIWQAQLTGCEMPVDVPRAINGVTSNN